MAIHIQKINPSLSTSVFFSRWLSLFGSTMSWRQPLLLAALWVAAWPLGRCLAFQLTAPTTSSYAQRWAFSSPQASSSSSSSLDAASTWKRCPKTTTATSRSSSTVLFSGTGIATNYTWKEEAFEIEISVLVPRETCASDISYKATSNSIDLRLKSSSNDNTDDDDIILLDGKRKTRGRIALDGTFWVISDYNDIVTTDEDTTTTTTTTTLPRGKQQFRQVTVTIEKLLRSAKNGFEVVDYDWKGVYPDDEDEVSFRKYDEAEKLNVREYAQTLGVDIDNINMSMVDKSMYSSGLNITQSALDELTKVGLVKEVTRQSDGSEFAVNPESGELEPYSPLTDTKLLTRPTATAAAAGRTPKPSADIPFLDTDSPWHQTQKKQQEQHQQQQPPPPQDEDASSGVMQFDKETNQTVIRQTREFTRSAFAQDAAAAAAVAAVEKRDETASATTVTTKKNIDVAKDPIDLLTVQRLKEILKSQGQKTSGTKKELQDRLRQQVNTLLQGKQE